MIVLFCWLILSYVFSNPQVLSWWADTLRDSSWPALYMDYFTTDAEFFSLLTLMASL